MLINKLGGGQKFQKVPLILNSKFVCLLHEKKVKIFHIEDFAEIALVGFDHARIQRDSN